MPGPLAPATLKEYARLLTRSVKDSGGAFSGRLKAEVFAENDDDYALPAGIIFSDHGDDFPGHQARSRRGGGRFKKLPKTREEAFVLYHAPRSHLAVRFGRSGPLVVAEDPAAARDQERDHGFTYIAGAGGSRSLGLR